MYMLKEAEQRRRKMFYSRGAGLANEWWACTSAGKARMPPEKLDALKCVLSAFSLHTKDVVP